MNYRYNAFISYSHAADGKLAPALQTALQKFAKPLLKRRHLNIFRDEASLSASPHLWSNITKALDDSEYLIYMASLQSANSKWVIKEIEYWLEHKSLDTLLIVLTDGEIVWNATKNKFNDGDTNALPVVLKDLLKAEPFYVDLRTLRTEEDISLKNPIFKKEVLKLAAHLHRKEPKDLAGEEVRSHKRILLLRNGAIALLSFFLGISVLKTCEANDNAEKATINAEEAKKQSELAKEQSELAKENAAEAEKERDNAQMQTEIAQCERYTAEMQTKIAISERNRAQANYLISEANRVVEKDPTLALRLAERALSKSKDPVIFRDASYIYADNSLYRRRFYAGVVTKIAYSPDGKTILTGSASSSSAHLWDQQGNKLVDFIGHSGIVSSVVFSPDGNTVLTGSADGTVIWWDLKGTILQDFITEGFSNTNAIFSPDGKSILTSSFNRATLWNLKGAELQDFIFESEVLGNGLQNYSDDRTDLVTAIAFSPDGNTILTGTVGGRAISWDLRGNVQQKFEGHLEDTFGPDGHAVEEFNGHRDAITSVSFSPDGNLILTGSEDNSAFLWDVNGTAYQRFEGHSDDVIAIAFSPDGNTVLTGSKDGTARLWSLNGTTISEFKGHSGYVNGVAFSPDGRTVVTGSEDNSVLLWDVDTAVILEFVNSESIVTSAVFSPNGKMMLTGSGDKIARLWDQNGNKICDFNSVSWSVNAVAFSPDGKAVVTDYGNNTARLWDLKGNVIQEFKGDSYGEISSLVFSPDGRTIVIGSIGDTTRLWDLKGNKIQNFGDHAENLSSMAFSPDGKTALTGSISNETQLWDVEKGTRKNEFYISEMGSLDVSFSPDGNMFLTGSADNVARLWDLNGNQIQEFIGHSAAITAVAFSPDGKSVLTGSDSGDQTVRLWDLKGNVIQVFKGHLGEISSVAFSPDGKQILTGSRDGTARLWNVLPLNEFLKSTSVAPLAEEHKIKYNIDP